MFTFEIKIYIQTHQTEIIFINCFLENDETSLAILNVFVSSGLCCMHLKCIERPENQVQDQNQPCNTIKGIYGLFTPCDFCVAIHFLSVCIVFFSH